MRSSRTVSALLVVAALLGGCRDAGPESSVDLGPVTLGEELSSNPDFVDGGNEPTGWMASSNHPGHVAEWRTDGGERYLALEAPLEENVPWPGAVSTFDMPVVGGTGYSVEVSARSDDFGLLFLSIAFRKADGTDIIAFGPGSVEVRSRDWESITFRGTAPEEAVSAYIIMRLGLNTSLTDEPFLSVEVNSVSIREILD